MGDSWLFSQLESKLKGYRFATYICFALLQISDSLCGLRYARVGKCEQASLELFRLEV